MSRVAGLDGGLVAVSGGAVRAELALPIAGLMSPRPFEEVAAALAAQKEAAAGLGCRLDEPFMQLAFLPLPVVPHLKITDFGLIDVDRMALVAAPDRAPAQPAGAAPA